MKKYKYSTKFNLNKHLKICKQKNIIDEANSSMNELVSVLNEQIKEQKRELELKENRRQFSIVEVLFPKATVCI